jgi:hypothetical protein
MGYRIEELLEVISDMDKIDYINRVFGENPDTEELSYGEVKKELKASMECREIPAETETERNLLTEKLDISKEMALLEKWASNQNKKG